MNAIRLFFQSDPKVAYFLAGAFVIALARLIRCGWRAWIEHEERKWRARQRAEAEERVKAAAAVGAINWPPNLGHKQPWKDKRFIA